MLQEIQMKNLINSETLGREWKDLLWNDEDMAFVKCDRVPKSDVWRLYAADGTELAVTDSRDLAFILARQHDFVPQSVH